MPTTALSVAFPEAKMQQSTIFLPVSGSACLQLSLHLQSNHHTAAGTCTCDYEEQRLAICADEAWHWLKCIGDQ